MPVSGQELATLDFSNLIGGPLNAIVEAQAKSAITTANFIKSVGFDKDGKIVNVDFKYNRKDGNGRDQDFCLTVPFLTMLPIPYITIETAEVEFNAKITSTTQTDVSSTFQQDIDAEVGGNYWFVRASLKSKTSYQKQSASSDREERTFDMRVFVRARNADMPAGTERLLNILENAIDERNDSVSTVGKLSEKALAGASSVKPVDVTGIQTGWTLSFGGDDYKVGTITGNSLAITPALKQELPAGTRFFANKDAPPPPQSTALAGPKPTVTLSVGTQATAGATSLTVADAKNVVANWTFTSGGTSYRVTSVSGTTVNFDPAVPTGSNIPTGNLVFTAP